MRLPVQQAFGSGCSSCDDGCGRGAAPLAAQASEHSSSARALVLLAGNPNAGKTTLFNMLSGANARVGNYPGITVDRRSAALSLPSGREVELVDLPGTYSLTARSPEEQVAADAVLGRFDRAPDAVIVVVDASTLSRSLYIAAQILESGAPVILALNMMDEAARGGIRVDARTLGERLGAAVVPMVAARGVGKPQLLTALDDALAGTCGSQPLALALETELEADVAELEAAIAETLPALPPRARRPWALWLLLSIGDDELDEIPPRLRAAAAGIQRRHRERGHDPDLAVIAARYAVVDSAVAAAVRREESDRIEWTARIDSVLTHPVAGCALFVFVMLLLFEALFSWAEPAMTLVEAGMSRAQDLVAAVFEAGVVRDLLNDGVIQGVGNVLVFVPQIALLFLFISFLEDSGYLARVAFIIDPVMSRLGLHGRAFVPLLSGFACAVPAVMATRTIESRRDRLVTMLCLPLMSCSARLPVYVLLIGTVFAGQGKVLGFVSVGAAALLAMYLLSVTATLGVAALLGRTLLPGKRPALVLELPPYRMPLARNLALAVWQRVRTFVREAGTVILLITLVLWALLRFPHSDEVERHFADARAAATQAYAGEELEGRVAALHSEEAGAQLAHSVGGRVGKALEPVLTPLGFDWRIGVGILGAFAAREVFVSTLGVVFGIEQADESSSSLREALASARRNDGSKLMTPLTGVTLMVFFVLACQCMSTIAIVWRESGSLKWPLFMLGYMSALAYGAAFVVHAVGSALGWGTA